MLARIAQLRALEQRAADRSAEAQSLFEQRGQLLPRERVGLLLDPGAPWLPLCHLAGYLQDSTDAASSVPGGGVIAGIGFVRGVRCMVVASDSGIEAGALQPMGLQKMLRVQEIALQQRLPFVHLVESAGANLMRYRVEDFVQGGALFRNLARLSAAGIPVLTVQHGSGTAGGAYLPGLSDIVILVRGRSRAFLAGPPLLQAATGEVASEEELGGAEMHASVSGLGEYLAGDDREALGIARDVVGRLALTPTLSRKRERESQPGSSLPLPLVGEGGGEGAREDLLSLMPLNLREPVDSREIMLRLADDASLLEFKSLYGPATVCAQASIAGHAV
ncbi:MAG: carboxyl transferase domain protein, partial [Ramlibacter sp.]|nr:carboxyl transferase domain protein [Ramlibacter sp.]